MRNIINRVASLNTLMKINGIDISVAYRPVIKNNITLDAITLKGNNRYEMIVYWIEEWNNMDDNKLAETLLGIIKQNRINVPAVNSIFGSLRDRAWILNHIRIKLISDKNMEYIRVHALPIFHIMDMFAIFYVDVTPDMNFSGGQASLNLTEDLLRCNMISLEEAYDAAIRNMDNDIDIRNIVCEAWVCTNPVKTNGAAVMLCPSCVKALRNHFDGDFYILPSSVHEIIAVPADADSDLQEIANIMRSINATGVNAVDRLTDSVYLFSENRLTRVM